MSSLLSEYTIHHDFSCQLSDARDKIHELKEVIPDDQRQIDDIKSQVSRLMSVTNLHTQEQISATMLIVFEDYQHLPAVKEFIAVCEDIMKNYHN